MKLGCVIVNYNSSSESLELLQKLTQYEKILSIVVVDNNSDEKNKQFLRQYKHPKVYIIECDRNGGYGKGNNIGIKFLNEKGFEHVLICNPDTFISENAINETIYEFDKDKKCLAIAPMAIDVQGIPYDSSWDIPTIPQYVFSLCFFLGKKYRIVKNSIRNRELNKVDCLSGALLFIDVKHFLSFGGYDENIFLYCEETSLGIDAKLRGLNSYIYGGCSYNHNHRYSEATLRQKLKQMKQTLVSRRYVLKKKMRAPFNWMLLFHLMKIFIYSETILSHVLHGLRKINK